MEKIRKKVLFKAGWSQKSREISAKDAVDEWKNTGWSVVEISTGSRAIKSYLILEKDLDTQVTKYPPTPFASIMKKSFKITIGIFAFILLIAIFSDDETENNPVIDNPYKANEAQKWYHGGTLHQSILSDWKNATVENKIATSADMIIASNERIKKEVFSKEDRTNKIPDLYALKPYAKNLVACYRQGY